MRSLGKGTQAPNIKDKFCICHLVSFNKDHMRQMEEAETF